MSNNSNLDAISRNFPIFLAICVVVSAFYNFGFLNSARADLIQVLSYQDFIISSIYAVPTMIGYIGVVGFFKNNLLKDIEINIKSILAIGVFLITSIIILYSDNFEFHSIGWILMVVGLAPTSYKIFSFFKIDANKDVVLFLSLSVVAMIASYGLGHSSFRRVNCMPDAILFIDGCQECYLIKRYNNFIIARDKAGYIHILNNIKNYEYKEYVFDFKNIQQLGACINKSTT